MSALAPRAVLVAVATGLVAVTLPPRAVFGYESASVVAVLGFHDSRLADEIKRELESSHFEVLSAEIGARRWQDVARAVDGGRLLRGVAVDEKDRTLTVYTRTAPKAPSETKEPSEASETVDIRLVLAVNPADRMARRHACLSVVELLHALSESEPAIPADALHAAGARPWPGVAGAPAATRATAKATGQESPHAIPPPAEAAAAGATADLAPAPGTRERGWQLGVGTTFDLETNGGGPTSHVQFLGRLRATSHLALCAQALWPLLAAQSRTNGSDIRAWTFGAALSPQYTFMPRQRLQPFIGLGLGARLGLIETTPSMAAQSGQAFTVSGTMGIEAGVRYSLGPFVQLYFELGAARAWRIPIGHADDLARKAANGESARASVGVLFES